MTPLNVPAPSPECSDTPSTSFARSVAAVTPDAAAASRGWSGHLCERHDECTRAGQRGHESESGGLEALPERPCAPECARRVQHSPDPHHSAFTPTLTLTPAPTLNLTLTLTLTLTPTLTLTLGATEARELVKDWTSQEASPNLS